MDTHVAVGTFDDTAHRLDVRLLRFRERPAREDPALLALELASAGRAHDAIEVLDAALARDPDDADLLLACGEAALHAGKLAFAQHALTRAAALAPGWPEPLRRLARVLSMRGRHDKAVEVARRAVASGARDPELVAMVQAEDRRRALQARLALFRADPDREEPALLAQALLDEGRAQDALEVVRAATARDDDADLRMIEARARLARGETAEAERALERACALAPEWIEPARALAECLRDRGEIERAHEVARPFAGLAEALAIPPSGASALDELLGVLERIDPIGDETRRRLARCDTLVDEVAPVDEESPRPPRRGWLPRIARALFGATPPTSAATARPLARA